MAAAGVIAAFGVIYANTTPIVGAVAISPDILPISATGTAARSWFCQPLGRDEVGELGVPDREFVPAVGELERRERPGRVLVPRGGKLLSARARRRASSFCADAA